MHTSATFKNESAELRVATIVSILLGAWVLVSPFVLGVPAKSAVMWNNVVVGAIAIVLGLVGGKHEAFQGLTVVLATWLFASTFVLNFSGLGFMWNNVISVFALVAVAAYAGALRSFPSPDANHEAVP
jgi:hypothetical protein